MARRLQKPANGTEREALRRWQESYPIVAMRTLADAGYSAEARADFLRKVAGCRADVWDFASDSYIRLFD